MRTTRTGGCVSQAFQFPPPGVRRVRARDVDEGIGVGGGVSVDEEPAPEAEAGGGAAGLPPVSITSPSAVSMTASEVCAVARLLRRRSMSMTRRPEGVSV